MKIGIIGAMKIEIEQLRDNMQNVKIERISQIDFYSGELYGKDVIVAVSGVGKVNAAICTQTMIMKYSPSLIINTGVAGGISDKINIGDIVIGTAVVQHDMDTSALGDPVGMISGINMVEIPCSSKVVDKLVEASGKISGTGFFNGIIATGDKFMCDAEDFERIARQFGAIACEMEAGSIGQVCYINGVDFAVVRAISDNGDNSAHIDFNQFCKAAALKSIQLMKRFLELV